GELPLDLQPALLRVLENRQFRRIGSNSYKPCDVRTIAATNRDLRTEVNAGRFRPDLYFRLAVVRIAIPPLRKRPQDIPLLRDKLVDSMAVEKPVAAALRSPKFLAELERGAWPGNVRELRNHVEQRLVFQDLSPDASGTPTQTDTKIAIETERS